MGGIRHGGHLRRVATPVGDGRSHCVALFAAGACRRRARKPARGHHICQRVGGRAGTLRAHRRLRGRQVGGTWGGRTRGVSRRLGDVPRRGRCVLAFVRIRPRRPSRNSDCRAPRRARWVARFAFQIAGRQVRLAREGPWMSARERGAHPGHVRYERWDVHGWSPWRSGWRFAPCSPVDRPLTCAFAPRRRQVDRSPPAL
jgi:hypothetical protein